MTPIKLIFIAIPLTLIEGCAMQSNFAPVTPEPIQTNQVLPSPAKSNQPIITKIEPIFYTVKKNDTLYSIARVYKVDYRQLALWNQLPQSFTIKVGQKLRITDPESGSKTSPSAMLPAIKIEEQSLHKVPPLLSNPTNQNNRDALMTNRFGPQPSVSTSLNNKENLIHDLSNEADNPINSTENHEVFSEKKSNISINNETMLKLNFQWPIKGKILNYFSHTGNKGIDIASEIGQQVGAAEAGKVAYSGQGPIGYGNLLIIKHNDLFLSAYANNSRLLVTEGQTVKKGEVIANVGQIGSNKTSLHFEIRKNGKPVNPLSFLPGK